MQGCLYLFIQLHGIKGNFSDMFAVSAKIENICLITRGWYSENPALSD